MWLTFCVGHNGFKAGEAVNGSERSETEPML